MLCSSLLARGVTGAATVCPAHPESACLIFRPANLNPQPQGPAPPFYNFNLPPQLAAARSTLQAAVLCALPSQAAHHGLLSISRFSTGITEVRPSPLGAMHAPTGSGLGWAGMAGEGARCFISTGPLHDETLKQAQDLFRLREAALQEEVRQLREQVSILTAPVASLEEAAAGEEPLPLLEPRLARLEAQVANLEGRWATHLVPSSQNHFDKFFLTQDQDQAAAGVAVDGGKAASDSSKEIPRVGSKGSPKKLVDPLVAEGKKLLAADPEALLKAADEGDVTKIHQIVAAGGDVEVTGENGHEAAIMALVAAKADVDAMDPNGMMPLHYAAESGHEAAIKALLAAKTDVDAQDEDGHEAAIMALVAAKADVDAMDPNGMMPLHYAAESGHEAAIKALLAAKADVDARDWNGMMPLHCAAANGREAAIKALASAKADVHAWDKDRNTPLQWAHKTGETSAAQLLRELGATV